MIRRITSDVIQTIDVDNFKCWLWHRILYTVLDYYDVYPIQSEKVVLSCIFKAQLST